jgi:hypothetical protein
MDLAIGELSRRTGVKVPTIRYYEQIGLLPPPVRTEGQQRRCGSGEVSVCLLASALIQWGWGEMKIDEVLKLKRANFLAYLSLMYYRSILNGEGKLYELVHHRYPSIRPTAVREYVTREGL